MKLQFGAWADGLHREVRHKKGSRFAFRFALRGFQHRPRRLDISRHVKPAKSHEKRANLLLGVGQWCMVSFAAPANDNPMKLQHREVNAE